MSIKGGISGSDDFRRAARDLRIIHVRTMRREIRAGINEGLRPLREDVLEEIPRKMPSGYAPVLAKALRVEQRTRLAIAGPDEIAVRVRLFARGRVKLRDLTARNRGELRHPVYARGPRTTWTWKLQRVPPGVIDEPWGRVEDRVVDSIDKHLSRMADRYNAGR